MPGHRRRLAQSLGFRVKGLGFRLKGLGFEVYAGFTFGHLIYIYIVRPLNQGHKKEQNYPYIFVYVYIYMR